MNADSKHGTCCKCPALMADGRIFTSWEPHRAFHSVLSQSANAPDSESLRYALQANPSLVQIKENDVMANFVCKGTQFNVDSSNFHKMLNDVMLNEVKKTNDVVGIALKEYASF
jgi:hypothetical protein